MVGYPGVGQDARAAGRLARHGGALLWDLFLWFWLAVLIGSVLFCVGGLVYVIVT